MRNVVSAGYQVRHEAGSTQRKWVHARMPYVAPKHTVDVGGGLRRRRGQRPGNEGRRSASEAAVTLLAARADYSPETKGALTNGIERGEVRIAESPVEMAKLMRQGKFDLYRDGARSAQSRHMVWWDD